MLQIPYPQRVLIVLGVKQSSVIKVTSLTSLPLQVVEKTTHWCETGGLWREKTQKKTHTLNICEG